MGAVLWHNRWECRVGRPHVFCIHCSFEVFSFLAVCHCHLSSAQTVFAALLLLVCFWSQRQISGCQAITDLSKVAEVWALLSGLIMLGFIDISSFAVLFSAWCGLGVCLRYSECITNNCGWGGGFVWTNQARFDIIRWCFTCMRMDEILCKRIVVSVHSVCSFSGFDNGCWHNGFLGVCRKPSIVALVRTCRAHVVVAVLLLSSVNTCCS